MRRAAPKMAAAPDIQNQKSQRGRKAQVFEQLEKKVIETTQGPKEDKKKDDEIGTYDDARDNGGGAEFIDRGQRLWEQWRWEREWRNLQFHGI